MVNENKGNGVSEIICHAFVSWSQAGKSLQLNCIFVQKPLVGIFPANAECEHGTGMFAIGISNAIQNPAKCKSQPQLDEPIHFKGQHQYHINVGHGNNPGAKGHLFQQEKLNENKQHTQQKIPQTI